MWRLLPVLILLALSSCGPEANAKTVVEVFISARDSGDVDGAMSVLAPEVILHAPNELEFRGAAQVRQWLQGTLADYSYQPSAGPTLAGAEVSWNDNLYSLTGSRWIGEIEWQATISQLKITNLHGRVLRGASGIICPQCPPGTRI